MPSDLQSGDFKPLNVTKQAQHRVVIGLGWDPADEPGIIEKIGSIAKGKPTHHDLDLSCFIFNQKKELLGTVSADPDFAIDASGKIYHSGDSTEGVGDGDDEEISVELKNLHENIHHIIFTAFISTGQSFDSVNSPEIRIADGYTNHNFLHRDLNAPQGAGKNGYAFIRLSRSSSDDWVLHCIDDYPAVKNADDIVSVLQSYF